MHELVAIARRNPLVLIAGAGLAGWILGAGALPFSLPGLGGSAPMPTDATHPSSTAPVAGAPGRTASVSTSSASMPAAGAEGSATDPFAGYGI